MYKQKAPVDLLFLEFHTDIDVTRIVSFLSVSGEGKVGRGGGTHQQSNLDKWSLGRHSKAHYWWTKEKK